MVCHALQQGGTTEALRLTEQWLTIGMAYFPFYKLNRSSGKNAPDKIALPKFIESSVIFSFLKKSILLFIQFSSKCFSFYLVSVFMVASLLLVLTSAVLNIDLL